LAACLALRNPLALVIAPKLCC